MVKGPRAALYGSDAIGGVIQIFTRDMARGEAEVNLKTGTDNFKAFDATTGLEFAGIKNTLSVSRELSDGFSVTDSQVDDDGYNRSAASLKGSTSASESLSFNWLGKVEEGDSEFDNGFAGDITGYKNTQLSVGSELTLKNTQLGLLVGQSRILSELMVMILQVKYIRHKNKVLCLKLVSKK